MSGSVPQKIDVIVQYHFANTAEYDWSDVRIRYPFLFKGLFINSLSSKKPVTEATQFSDLNDYLKADLSIVGVVIDHFTYFRHDISIALTVVPAQYHSQLGQVPDFNNHSCKFIFLFHRFAKQFLYSLIAVAALIYKSTIAIFRASGVDGRTYTKFIIAVISKPPSPFSTMTNKATSSPSKKVRLRPYDSSCDQSIPVATTVETSEKDDQAHGERSNPNPDSNVLLRCCDVLHVHTSLSDCTFDLTNLTIKESADHFNSHINDATKEFGRRKARADENAFTLIHDTKRCVINASPFKYFYQEEHGEEITLRVAEPSKFVVADDGKD